MGFFDKQNLKHIANLLHSEWPGTSITQIQSDYRDDGREVIRVHIRENVYLDLAENDLDWFSVIVAQIDGVWTNPSKRRTKPLGVKAWATYQEVADAFSESIEDLRILTFKFSSMSREEAEEFVSEIFVADEEVRDQSVHEQTPPKESKPPWGWIIGIGIAILLLLGSCGSNTWQMGRDGTGSRVQCEDGTWSNSGGKPGACSWHGGVK